MTDGSALRLAILADPGDDLLRLVYADWLEEAGEVERAELIRVQLEQIHTPSPGLATVEQRLLGPAEDRVWQRRREWALPASVRNAWPDDVGGWEWHRGLPEVWHAPLALWEAHGTELAALWPIRRVVIIDREPQPSTANPWNRERTWFRDEPHWLERPDEGSLLPPALFDLLELDSLDLAMFDYSRTYPTRAAAIAALSDACLRLILPERNMTLPR